MLLRVAPYMVKCQLVKSSFGKGSQLVQTSISCGFLCCVAFTDIDVPTALSGVAMSLAIAAQIEWVVTGLSTESVADCMHV